MELSKLNGGVGGERPIVREPQEERNLKEVCVGGLRVSPPGRSPPRDGGGVPHERKEPAIQE